MTKCLSRHLRHLSVLISSEVPLPRYSQSDHQLTLEEADWSLLPAAVCCVAESTPVIQLES